MLASIKHGYIILLLVVAVPVIAQVTPLNAHREYAFSTSLTDYEALNINPANLSLCSPHMRKFSLSFLKVEGLLNSEPTKQYLFNRSAFHQREGNPTSLTAQELMKQPFTVNSEITYAGGTLQTKWGAFAFSLKSEVYVQTDFNDFANSVLFRNGFDHYIDTIVKIVLDAQANGKKDMEKKVLTLLNESFVKLNVTHEINLGYSHKVYHNGKLQLFAGIGIKYILGQADVALKFNAGEMSGYVSKIAFLHQSLGALNLPEDDKKQKVSGNGFGGSIGTTMVYDNKLRVGVSFADLGFIKWPVNPITVKPGFTDSVKIDKGVVNGVEDLVASGIFYYQGKEKNIEVLPAKFIVSASYQVHRYIHLYADLVVPIVNTPKNLQSPLAGIGAQFSILDWVFIKTGPSIIDKTFSLPTYINIFAGKRSIYEFSVGTSDLLSYCIKSRESIQAGVGIFRLHFGELETFACKDHSMYRSRF